MELGLGILGMTHDAGARSPGRISQAIVSLEKNDDVYPPQVTTL